MAQIRVDTTLYSKRLVLLVFTASFLIAYVAAAPVPDDQPINISPGIGGGDIPPGTKVPAECQFPIHIM